MNNEQFCQDCHHSNSCQMVYQQIGNTKNPSVFCQVLAVLLGPLLIFIISLAAFEKLAGFINISINTKKYQAAVSFLLASIITFVYMFAVKAINKRLKKSKCPQE